MTDEDGGAPTNYAANSRKAKEASSKPERPEKKLDKVISGNAIQKKQGIGQKFKTLFMSGDFKYYVIQDMVKPSLRAFAWDFIIEGARRAIGERDTYGRSRPPSGGFGPSPQRNYAQPVQRTGWGPQPAGPLGRDPAYIPDQHRFARDSRRDPYEYLVPTRDDAENCLESLATVIEQWDNVSVADLHELLGLTQSHVDQKWGWTHLNGATYRQVRDGYLLVLPPVEQLQGLR
jgi:hypothetical protein